MHKASTEQFRPKSPLFLRAGRAHFGHFSGAAHRHALWRLIGSTVTGCRCCCLRVRCELKQLVCVRLQLLGMVKQLCEGLYLGVFGLELFRESCQSCSNGGVRRGSRGRCGFSLRDELCLFAVLLPLHRGQLSRSDLFIYCLFSFTEKVSIDSLLKMKNPDSVRAVVGNILRQMFSEGSEEVGSSVINAVGDLYVSALTGNRSEFEERLEYNRARSSNDREALWKTIGEGLGELIRDFVGGAISGGIFGAGGTAIMGVRQAAADTRQGRAIQDAGQAETVQEFFKNITQSERWQERIQAADVDTKNARALGKAARQAHAVSMDRAITERLRALGDHTTLGDIVTAIRSKATGQRLTASERAALKRSRFGAQVAEEFKTAMEGESTDGNRWAVDAMDAERSYFEKLTTRAQANKIVKDGRLKAEFEEKTGVTLEGPLGEQARTVMEESQKKLEAIDADCNLMPAGR